MPNINLEELSISLHSLTIFKTVKNDSVVKALIDYIDTYYSLSKDLNASSMVEKYSNILFNLYETGHEHLSSHICEIVSNNENIFIKRLGAKITPSPLIQHNVEQELDILNKLANLDSNDILPFDQVEYLPAWKLKPIDLKKEYLERANNIEKYGYGIYAKYHMFFINEQNEIVPVKNPDPIRLSDLIDYKYEQGIIIDNTKALLAGKPASNILLTGDAGTGKSSTVKAVCNELYKEGLRILEVRKEQLRALPALLDELTTNPLKFIIFIDDLSFQEDDDNFSSLKAILEGSISAKSKNVVIYATSNRRHIIREKFSDREDDLSKNDTMQESVSLSERFGIQIWFDRPNKETYLDIITHLLDENNIEYDKEIVTVAAERYALSRANRSARAAKQFVDQVISNSINVK
jgi:uncharacterized protein